MTPYLIYLSARRPDLTQKHPDWPFGQFAKTIGAEWAKKSDAEKAPYVKISLEDKARYEAEMAAYEAMIR